MAKGEERDEARAVLRVFAGGASAEARRDDALVRAFLDGDELALGDLLKAHERLVLAVVRRYARSPDEAADLVQRAFLRALEASRRSRARSGDRAPVPFRAWLLRIAVNLGKNAARDAARWPRAPLAALENTAAALPSAEEALLGAERARLVRQAVVALPPRQRQVLTLRVDAELTFQQIGEVLGITEGHARVHFYYAARRLRQALAGREGA